MKTISIMAALAETIGTAVADEGSISIYTPVDIDPMQGTFQLVEGSHKYMGSSALPAGNPTWKPPVFHQHQQAPKRFRK